MSLQDELENLLNRERAENASNTPDFLLAEYLVSCLRAFNRISTGRDAWYAMNPEPGTDWRERMPEQPENRPKL